MARSRSFLVKENMSVTAFECAVPQECGVKSIHSTACPCILQKDLAILTSLM